MFTKGQTAWNKDRKFPQFSGENHWNWKGGTEYFSVHDWLKKTFGKANKCENSICSGKCKIFHWAKLKDKAYEKKRENFWMLCQSCHAIYDGIKPICKFPKGMIPYNKGKKLHYRVWNKQSIPRICQTCHKKFEVSPSIVKINKGKYCSKFCFDEFQRKNINYEKIT